MFRRFFLGAPGPAGELLTLRAQLRPGGAGVLAGPGHRARPADGTEEQAVLGLMASDVDALRHKSFAACTPASWPRCAGSWPGSG